MLDEYVIGHNIKRIRTSKGMTQLQLSKAISKSLNSIKKYESGYTVVPTNVLMRIANALDVDILTLLPSINTIDGIFDADDDIEHFKDNNGVTICKAVSTEKYKNRIALRQLLNTYGLIEKDFPSHKLDQVENILLPYLEILIENVNNN